MTAGRAFVDTNVLVYAYDHDEPTKQARAAEVLSELVQRGQAVISTQVLQEFYWVVTRKLSVPLAPSLAEEAVRELSDLPVVPVDRLLVLDAVRLCRERELSLWDALIVRAALAAGCARLLTEILQDGSAFGPLRVENPFAGGETGS
jgi:predicted nucleic acid-binding protein